MDVGCGGKREIDAGGVWHKYLMYKVAVRDGNGYKTNRVVGRLILASNICRVNLQDLLYSQADTEIVNEIQGHRGKL